MAVVYHTPLGPHSTKLCKRCGNKKLATEFYKNPQAKDGYRAHCKECNKEVSATNIPATKAMRKTGLSRRKYDQIHEQQGGLCAICGQPETSRNQWGIKKLATDHDHVTGKFRGLLCYVCNIKLGILEDQEFVKAAQVYIERTC